MRDPGARPAATLRRLPVRLRLWHAGALALVTLIVINQSAPSGGVATGAFLTATSGAAIVAWGAVRRVRRGNRLPVALVAAGLSLSAVADVAWEVIYARLGYEPDVSWADVPWLASYVAIGAGLMLVDRTRRDRLDIDALIDAGVVTTVTALLVWQLSLSSTVGDGSVPAGVRAVWAAYPILDIGLLAIVVHRVLSGRLAWSGLLLAAGAVAWLVVDLAWMLLIPTEQVGAWLDAGWMVGPGLLAAGAWASADRHLPARRRRPPSTARVALTFVPVLMPRTIEILFGDRHLISPIPMLVATATLVYLAFLRTIRYLRAREDAEQAVASSSRFFRALATNSSDGALVLAATGRVRRATPNVSALLGCSETTLIDADPRIFVAEEDQEPWANALERVSLHPGAVVETEFRLDRDSSRLPWFSARFANLLDDPDVEGIVVNLHEITDRKRAEEELTHQAFHDALTGLANRALFRNRVDHALQRCQRSAHVPAALYLDLDGFKTVNDSLGHEAGDVLLTEVAQRLKAAVRAVDTVARLGGDEFGILIEQSTRPREDAVGVAERILAALEVPIRVGEDAVTVSVSIGISIGDPVLRATTLLRNADIAMYRAKAAGKNCWVLYDPEMSIAAVERLRLETGLRQALDQSQLWVAYQPIVSLGTEEIVGFEALLRWDHPELGLIMPDRFIPIAEETGLILPIGRWVLQTACETAAAWHERFPGRPHIAVNLSGRQLASTELLADVAHALTTSGLDPGSLVLEMTETVLVRDAEAAAERLRALRHLGVRLAIDDFGTGYSSLSYLRQFPIDIIKIDRSFVESISDTDSVPAIVRGLLDLGHTLRLETLAEGIELPHQRDRLLAESCDLGQGFLFARPMAREDVERFLTRLAPAIG